MKYSVYRFTLDIHVTRSQVSIPVLYRDTGIRFLISLSDGGKPYVIQEGNIAVFYGKKADGTYLTRPCVINNNTEIQYDFTEQTTSYEGIVDAEIRLFGTDRKLITSPSFNIVVDPRVLRDEDLIESVTETSPLDNVMLTAIEKVSNAVNKVLPEGVTLQVIESDIEIDGDLVVREDLTVDGDLVIKGKTKSVEHETLTVNDNIIVTNVGSTNLDSLSGLVINTGETDEDGNIKGYGIVYEPSSDSVKLGLGTITKAEDKLAEFAFDEGEAQALVTRGDDFEEAASNIIPMWDSVKKALVPSGKSVDDFVPSKADGTLINKVYGINAIGVNSIIRMEQDAVAYSVVSRTSTGQIRVPAEPEHNNDAISKGYADTNYRKRITTTSGSYLYGHVNGADYNTRYGTNADGGYVVQRTGGGNVRLPDQIETPPANVDDAISQKYADSKYVALKTNTTTLAQVYTKETDGTQRMLNVTAGATPYAMATRVDDGTLLAGNLDVVKNSSYSSACVSKAYVADLPTYCHTISASGQSSTGSYDSIKILVYSNNGNPFNNAQMWNAISNHIWTFITAHEGSVDYYGQQLLSGVNSANATIELGYSSGSAEHYITNVTVTDTVTPLSSFN